MVTRWFIADYRDWKAVASRHGTGWVVEVFERTASDRAVRQFTLEGVREEEAALGQAINRFRGELYARLDEHTVTA